MRAANPERGLFIAGTDTGVGKTRVTVGLLRAMSTADRRVVGMKPVASGAEQTAEGLINADAAMIAAASPIIVPIRAINPYCFATPVSPHIAALRARQTIDIEPIVAAFAQLASYADFVLVEGTGGWLTPINREQTMADIATRLGLPVVLVVGLKLGCLNHAALTARALGSHGAGLAGWIGNSITPDFDRETANIAALEKILQEPAATIVSYASQGPEALELPPAAARQLMARR